MKHYIAAFFLISLSACKKESGDVEKAQGGDNRAQFKVAQDFIKNNKCHDAFFWGEKAIIGGNVDALSYFGMLHLKGICTPSSPEKAYTYFKMAAEKNHADGLNNIAVLLLLGEGRKKNEKLAVDYLKKAAGQSWSESQFNLGICYYLGVGVGKNTEIAEQYFEKSIKRGIHAVPCEKVKSYILKFKNTLHPNRFWVRRWADLNY